MRCLLKGFFSHRESHTKHDPEILHKWVVPSRRTEVLNKYLEKKIFKTALVLVQRHGWQISQTTQNQVNYMGPLELAAPMNTVGNRTAFSYVKWLTLHPPRRGPRSFTPRH